jgi:pimeloyl-ACP methyl ester carboxylesterase
MTSALPDLPGVRHASATVAGVRLHYAEAGDGPPVVLLHGWPQSWWCWREVIPLLAPERRVICPDLRGFGWSQAPAHGYAKLRLADDLLGLLDALGLERVPLVGHDWGAFAGFLAAMHHPERIERLVALAIVPPWSGPGDGSRADPRPLLRLWYMAVLATPGLGPLAIRRGAVGEVLRRGRGLGEWDPATVSLYEACIRRPGSVRATGALYRTFLTRELPDLLRGRYDDLRLTVPARLIVGTEDPVIQGLPDSYDAFADDLVVEQVDGGGHFLPEECPELVAERVHAMLARA